MKLIFSGKVESGDACRVGNHEYDGAFLIGGVDVVGRINQTKFGGRVTVGIADERFNGPLAVDLGWGYSEYTPMDADTLKVGEHDLLDILERYEGQDVIMYVADEPVNVLEADVVESV